MMRKPAYWQLDLLIAGNVALFLTLPRLVPIALVDYVPAAIAVFDLVLMTLWVIRNEAAIRYAEGERKVRRAGHTVRGETPDLTPRQLHFLSVVLRASSHRDGLREKDMRRLDAMRRLA